MFLDYYRKEGVRQTCHAVKGDYGTRQQEEAIKTIARYFIEQKIVKPGDYIIPAPQHTGRAEYTLKIAKIVANETGAIVLDILRRTPEPSLYDQKLSDKENVGGINTKSAPNMFLAANEGQGENIPADGRLFFLDNVYATGKTFQTAKDLIGYRLMPLIYAKDKGMTERQIKLMTYKSNPEDSRPLFG